MVTNKQYFYGTGRRKSAIARVRLYPGTGQIVVESGPERLNQWVDFDRDIEADFKKAFGETPGALIGLGLMTDSNNSGATVTAWYGPLDVTLSSPRP